MSCNLIFGYVKKFGLFWSFFCGLGYLYIYNVGTRRSKGVPGSPGNLKVRVSQRQLNGSWTNTGDMNINSNTMTIGDTTVDLKKGTVSLIVF